MDKKRELLAQLAQEAEALRASDGWQRWLDTAKRFRTYSLRNQLLIQAQRPGATHVAGYRAWQQLGRQVKKGETGIAILAPMTRKAIDEDTNEAKSVLFGFRIAHVFDVTQTEGDELDIVRLPDVDIDDPQLLGRLVEQAQAAGLVVQFADEGPGGARGWYVQETRTINVVRTLPVGNQVRTMLHELGHAHDPFLATSTHRPWNEVVAESAAYLVAATLGLDIGDASTVYVTSWGGNVEELEGLAQRVLTTAGRMEELLASICQPAA